jgi:Uma2 family endonuclease
MAAVQPIQIVPVRAQKRAARYVPPLQSGDHLTLAEFERRYEAMPEVKKAELVEGVVYMPSPISSMHAHPTALVTTWLGTYAAYTPGLEGLDDATVILGADNEFQPDVQLRRLRGGTSCLNAKGYVEGPPGLVTEVALSSASYDLHEKMRVYQRAGVSEYIVWRVQDKALDWWVAEAGVFTPLKADRTGVIRSRVFPGLWLARRALLADNMAAVLRTLQEGLQSPEHAAFVESLAA